MPFTQDQFMSVFADYNLSVWPAQILFNVLALISLFLIIKKYTISDRFINSVLALFWLWMGIVYHIIFFSGINPGANIFGGLFILQGLIFLFSGVIKENLKYSVSNSPAVVTGFILILFALFIYPFLGILFNHTYPSNPTFGLPCPTTIFTFGILLFSVKKIPVYVIIIPFIWSLIGFTAALNLGIYEDTGLLITGLVSVYIIIFYLNRKERIS